MKKKQKIELPTKDRLIMAGIDVIEQNGIQGFSLRKAADRCGISCAAPYKHFKNKEALLTTIISYINEEWLKCQDKIIKEHENDIKSQLISISIAYIGFLVDNPQYRSIIMISDKFLSEVNRKIRDDINIRVRDLIDVFCAQNAIPEQLKAEKVFMVRSLIYGAALMFDNGELEYNDENITMIYDVISHEFEVLPRVDK